MFQDLQILSVGAAAVLETVLLFAMLERRNGRYIRLWMLVLITGTWLWHSSTFFYMLLAAMQGELARHLRWTLMTVMTVGLLLMPSAILHGIVRLRRHGLETAESLSPGYALLYAPLLMVVPIAAQLSTNPTAPYLELVAPYIAAYMLWIIVANSISAIGAWQLRKSISLPRADLFFSSLAITLLLTTALTASAVLLGVRYWTSAVPGLMLLVTLLPVLPAVLFAYFVIRFNFLPLILERTLVYGAIAATLLLVHHVVLGDLQAAVSERYKVDFAILEIIAGVALILAYSPLRLRTAEALRYLLGSRVTKVRDQMRKLSVQMSGWAGQPVPEILEYFTASIQEPLRVDYVAAWIFNRDDQVVFRAGDTSQAGDTKALEFHRRLISTRRHWCTLRDFPDHDLLNLLQEAGASAAALIEHHEVRGILLFGRHSWHQQLGEEELNALILLIDQLGSTLDNSLLLGERLAAERRALQNEKLSTLGLLAGSIAHEVKNPLSSIKTIATVLSEQLNHHPEHAEDLRMILCEVDRLAATTSQLLEFARPNAGGTENGCVQTVIQSTVRIMRHVAMQRDVTMEVDVIEDLPPVAVDDNSLREIFFNLLSNSIDATGAGGAIQVTCHRQNGCVIAEIRDNGPGISPALQDRLFEPFFTTKETGTGLGLYVVGRRVREAGGEIHCISGHGRGTAFILKFPCLTT